MSQGYYNSMHSNISCFSFHDFPFFIFFSFLYWQLPGAYGLTTRLKALFRSKLSQIKTIKNSNSNGKTCHSHCNKAKLYRNTISLCSEQLESLQSIKNY